MNSLNLKELHRRKNPRATFEPVGSSSQEKETSARSRNPISCFDGAPDVPVREPLKIWQRVPELDELATADKHNLHQQVEEVLLFWFGPSVMTFSKLSTMDASIARSMAGSSRPRSERRAPAPAPASRSSPARRPAAMPPFRPRSGRRSNLRPRARSADRGASVRSAYGAVRPLPTQR